VLKTASFMAVLTTYLVYKSLDVYNVYILNSELDLLKDNQYINGSSFLFGQPSGMSFVNCVPGILSQLAAGKFNQTLSKSKCKQLKDMRFINDSETIVLVSFPGSGNTWTRLLLEQVTGIFTGSVYCDKELKQEAFLGESVASGNVIVVKTHVPGTGYPKMHRHATNPTNLKGAIFITRNPLDCLVSEWNGQNLHKHRHTAAVGKDYFGKRSKFANNIALIMFCILGNNYGWNQFVINRMEVFYPLYHYWLMDAKIPVLVIKYEDMVKNVTSNLRKMLNFLNVSYSEKDFSCVEHNEMKLFYRHKHYNSSYYLFTEIQRQIVLNHLRLVEPLLNMYNVTYKDLLNKV